jgi:hypothetical protein
MPQPPLGGLSTDHTHWIHPPKKDFFLPVGVLSKVFRGTLVPLCKQLLSAASTGSAPFCATPL